MQQKQNLFIGIDLGSSFIKISIIDQAQNCLNTVKVPSQEMPINSIRQGWGQQNPQQWWQIIQEGLKLILNNQKIDKSLIKGIGISYQMHGLVLINQQHKVIAPANIWCDSRATQVGQLLYHELCGKQLISKILNHPSNFTLVKLLWIKQNKKQLFQKIFKIMLPGDFIAMKLTGKVQTTKQGLSEGVFWDYHADNISQQILQIAGIKKILIPAVVQNFAYQSQTLNKVNQYFGFPHPIPIFYRSGDQPNNAFSLNVLEPGEVAVTGGTSGVIFAVTSQIKSKQVLKYNSFLHVNHTCKQPRIGKLLCINGCGSVYSWLQKNMFQYLSYEQMNKMALISDSESIIFIPFGNGAQRMISNKDIKCHIYNINYTKNKAQNIIRAAIEGIAFSFVYGAQLMKGQQINIQKLKAGKGNLFQCQAFCEIISTLLNVSIEIFQTNGSEGAAKGALFGFLKSKYQQQTLFQINSKKFKSYQPNYNKKQHLQILYNKWKNKIVQITKKQP